MAIRRSLRREPKRRERYSCHSPRSCTNTRLARPRAMTPLSPSSRGVCGRTAGVGAGGGEQEQQDAGDRRGDDEDGRPHRASGSGGEGPAVPVGAQVPVLAAEGAHLQRAWAARPHRGGSAQRGVVAAPDAQGAAPDDPSCGCAAWCAGPPGCRSSVQGAGGEAVLAGQGLVGEAIGEVGLTISSSSQYQRGRRVRTR